MGPAQELAAIEQAERNAALDDILSRWHHWRSGFRVEVGHDTEAAGFSGYLTSRQYDDVNGALDDAIEDDIMAAVDAVIDNMAPSYQLVLQVQARALYVGVHVFNSPRLPQSRQVRDELQRLARAELIDRLTAAGVLS
jgi:hypothetical protein